MGVNSTPHRAHLTRATHAMFLVCAWLEDTWITLIRASRESHSISSMFRGTLLDAPFSSPFSTPFATLAHSLATSPFAALFFGESIRCHSAWRITFCLIG